MELNLQKDKNSQDFKKVKKSNSNLMMSLVLSSNLTLSSVICSSSSRILSGVADFA